MESAFLLDVVVRKGPSILKLLASKDETLLVRGDALLVLDLGLDILNSVGRLNLKGDGLASESLNEDLHATPQAKNEMEGALLLYVVVREGSEKNRHLKETKIRTSQKAKNEEDIF